jgi:hypothetical protein
MATLLLPEKPFLDDGYPMENLMIVPAVVPGDDNTDEDVGIAFVVALSIGCRFLLESELKWLSITTTRQDFAMANYYNYFRC